MKAVTRCTVSASAEVLAILAASQARSELLAQAVGLATNTPPGIVRDKYIDLGLDYYHARKEVNRNAVLEQVAMTANGEK
jgi:hypothetical protein